MNRATIINALIAKIDGRAYLEIGSADGETFDKIICQKKVGVEPGDKPKKDSSDIRRMTSDEFFKINDRVFDVIFIDGLHSSEQVQKDITNALRFLSLNGYIVCHDMNPIQEEHQTETFTGGIWNGAGWKSFVKMRSERSDLFMCVVNTDHGCGIISRVGRSPGLLNNEKLTYQNLEKNRNGWLNLITPFEFYQIVIGQSIKGLLYAYITDPGDCHTNFSFGMYYESIGQTAAAVSYYIRTAERSDSDLLAYESLVRASMCFESQGTRGLSVRGLLQRAITLLPKRPEAHFLFSRFYEREKTVESWMNCYTVASIAEHLCDFKSKPLLTSVDYPGKYGILFEKAVSSWWVGLCDESRDIFIDLISNYELDFTHRKSVIANLKYFNLCMTKKIVEYDNTKHHSLKLKFNGSENIGRNYSESYQDMFVLTMLNGLRQGTYVEIGAGKPFYGNNTALLEQSFEWNGISIDFNEDFVDTFNRERMNKCLLQDATKVDYEELFVSLNYPKDINYLQLDCEPADVTLEILKRIPFTTRRFAVITFEHDAYCDETRKAETESREYLTSLGYKCVVKNIAPDGWRNYEDWWIHPELIDSTIFATMRVEGTQTKSAESYMMK